MLKLPRLIGHRGVARHAPENTLAGMRMAALQGAAWVELDVKLTQDNIPVILHDDTVDRTTDGHGFAAQMSFEAMRRLDAGAWFGSAFKGQRIPALSEVIETASALGLGLNLEIKPCPGREEETAGVAISMAMTLWPSNLSPPLVSSFSEVSLAMAQKVAPAWPRGYLMDAIPDDWAQKAESLDVATLHFNAAREDEASIARLRAFGKPLLAYTVNDPTLARRLFAQGVAAVFTDTPKQLYEGLL
jgi:glycerophosphoryl diester phosphodiesterase